MQTENKIPLIDSNNSLQFIVCERYKQTVYAGDYNSSTLLWFSDIDFVKSGN
jgi:hypothetical protein